MDKIFHTITLICNIITSHGSKNKTLGILILFFSTFCFCGQKAISQDSVKSENSSKYQPITDFKGDNKTSISGKIVDLDSEKPKVFKSIIVHINNSRIYTTTNTKGIFHVTIDTDTMYSPIIVDIIIEISFREKMKFLDVKIMQGENQDLGTIMFETPIFIGEPNYHRTTPI